MWHIPEQYTYTYIIYVDMQTWVGHVDEQWGVLPSRKLSTCRSGKMCVRKRLCRSIGICNNVSIFVKCVRVVCVNPKRRALCVWEKLSGKQTHSIGKRPFYCTSAFFFLFFAFDLHFPVFLFLLSPDKWLRYARSFCLFCVLLRYLVRLLQQFMVVWSHDGASLVFRQLSNDCKNLILYVCEIWMNSLGG